MLSLRARLFTIFSLAIMAILGISVFLLIKSRTDNTATDTSSPDVVAEQDTTDNSGNLEAPEQSLPSDISQPIRFKPATAEETEKNAVQQLAKIFIERLNSYSSDSKFQNIYDVKTLATENLWKTLSAKIGNNAAAQNYMARSTNVLSVNLVKFSENEAEVKLEAKVGETRNGTTETKDKTITVNLLKKDKNWLVDKYTW